ncbi:MCM DNA helicase complex subunit [Coemansia sp. RSA 1813]|nr:MCM DNA helicase complex subunit [Coemansia sp. RSA 1646]KAJ1765679.1 MCM DNA helicase complex subunit [Coemansia sp. RSA 1843]KAJ2088203.1 MCM DNA helicase complex subunit [Coemansia sp. RSA 986]KAJ2215755.1 MCM DNA helicase complex subunit [Coemansia sp. RSA 487]KAJ2562561.1 MCM DNA helicase complex subunit [Coemansia sp. RSA 1813]
MSGDPSSSPVLGHDSDAEEAGMGMDEYNTLPETPAPFSPPPLPLARNRLQSQQGRQAGFRPAAAAGGTRNAVLSSSPRIGFSDLPSTPGGGFGFGQSSQLAAGGMAMGYSEALSSQLGGMGGQQAGRSATGMRRGDLGSRAQALSSELGDMALNDVDPAGAQPAEIRTIWGTIVHVRDVMSTFRDFLLHFTPAHRPPANHNLSASELHEPVYPQLLKRMHDSEIYQLNIDAQNICAYPQSHKLYKQLANYPEEVVPIMDYVLTELYMEQFPDADAELVQSDLKVRPYNLSASTNMRDLNPSDIDKLVSIRGMLIRSSSVIPDMERAFFRCLQCDWTTTVGIDRGMITEPTQCGNTACLQKDTIELVHNRSAFADKQLSRLQETPEVIPDGQTPHTLTLVMHDELVDVAKPGDRLEITGIYRGVPVRTNPRMRTVQAIYRTYIDVVHIRRLGRSRVQRSAAEGLDTSEAVVDPQHEAAVAMGSTDGAADGADDSAKYQAFTVQEIDEFKRWSRDPRIFDILSRSLAPSIYELDDVKRGLLLQLFGGVRKKFDRAGAPRARGDINVLLVGDPGVAKSQMLSAVHSLAPRGIYTSGKGSSAVGLTAYVTRDPDTRQLVLESGALVLSDDGVCAIDEFDKMSESTRSVLHEVMEQQTISIAKAGIITSLNARCSILAAANPVDSKWNKDLSIVENMNLPPTLVSRFDLVFIVLDTVDETMDRRMARHIVGLYIDGGDSDHVADTTLPMVPTEQLTRYIAYARRYVRPQITEEAGTALVEEYVDLRRMGRDTAATTSGAVRAGASASGRVTATARQLESMIRMSEAHAKMRLSDTVDVTDVREASRLMREALRESATDPRTGLIDLDLLTTGFAASDRRQLDAIKRETRNLLLAAVRSSASASAPAAAAGGRSSSSTADSGLPDAPHAGNSASYQTWLDRLNEQSYDPVPPRLFDQVIRELQTEGIINVVGSGRNMLIVVKQSAIQP